MGIQLSLLGIYVGFHKLFAHEAITFQTSWLAICCSCSFDANQRMSIPCDVCSQHVIQTRRTSSEKVVLIEFSTFSYIRDDVDGERRFTKLENALILFSRSLCFCVRAHCALFVSAKWRPMRRVGIQYEEEEYGKEQLC